MNDVSAEILKEYLPDTSENDCCLSHPGREASLLPAIHGVVAVGDLVDASTADAQQSHVSVCTWLELATCIPGTATTWLVYSCMVFCIIHFVAKTDMLLH